MFALVIERNPVELKKLETGLRELGHEVQTASDPRSFPKNRDVSPPDIVFLCLDGIKEPALEWLRKNQEREFPIPVIVTSGDARLEDAVVFMKEGAHDFWVKPLDRDRLAKSLELIVSQRRTAASKGIGVDRPILSRNPIMLRLKEMAEKVAASSASVFIQGESGTGKELFARHIHRHSRRADKPFLAINCAALPENLLESELFGYEKGAFTGAAKTKAGKFELADGGTLLLDEVTEMSVPLQAKLLRVLQENEVDRLGGRYPISVDVRVIATTNAAMEESLAEGRFRRDLYYRLNVIPLKIPPLRERKEDIELLCRHFVQKYNERHGGSVQSIHPGAHRRLQEYSWPGNVRELENVVQRAVLLATGPVITAEGLVFDGDGAPGHLTASDSQELMALSEMEKRLIHKALESVDDNRTRAAEILGISVRTLRNKLNEYRAQGANVA